MNLFENLQKLNEEFYDGFKYKNKYYEIFKNPTSDEIRDIKNADKRYQSIRGIIDNNNDIYAWSGKIVHYDIKSKIDIQNFRFAYNEKEGWEFNILMKDELLEICKDIVKYESILWTCGDLEKNITIFYNIDDVWYFDDIEELKGYIEEPDFYN